MLPYHDRVPVLLQQAEIDRWLSGDMEARELHPAGETELREWPIDRRINRTGVGDDDSMTIEPIDRTYCNATISALAANATRRDSDSHCLAFRLTKC
ncbi:hypothetical protein [Methylovirgula ligni]|uniref:hypothetical protein n=1 Tax=Methylovirgula ligni TaxID=569860 RepID=UPI003CCAF4F7